LPCGHRRPVHHSAAGLGGLLEGGLLAPGASLEGELHVCSKVKNLIEKLFSWTLLVKPCFEISSFDAVATAVPLFLPTAVASHGDPLKESNQQEDVDVGGLVRGRRRHRRFIADEEDDVESSTKMQEEETTLKISVFVRSWKKTTVEPSVVAQSWEKEEESVTYVGPVSSGSARHEAFMACTLENLKLSLADSPHFPSLFVKYHIDHYLRECEETTKSSAILHRGFLATLLNVIKIPLAYLKPLLPGGREEQLRLRREALQSVSTPPGQARTNGQTMDEEYMLRQSLQSENNTIPESMVMQQLLQTQSLVRPLKEVSPVAGWAHLVFKIDLGEIVELCGEVEHHRQRLLDYTAKERAINNWWQPLSDTSEFKMLEKTKGDLELIMMDFNITRNAWTAPRYRVDFAKQVLERHASLAKDINARGTRDTSDELDLDREKRAIPLLVPLLLGLAGGVTMNGIFSSGSLRGLLGAHEHQNGFVVAQVARHEESLAWANAKLNKTGRDITNLLTAANHNSWHIQALSLDAALEPAVGVCRESVRRVSTGLNFLLAKRLTPELVGPEVILKAMEELESRTRGLNFELVGRDPSTIYQLSASFLQTAPDKFSVLIHLPLTHVDRSMALHEIIEFPVALPGIATIYTVEVGELMLAVDRRDSGYALLSPETLAACYDVGPKMLCPGLSFLLRDFSRTCPSALYKRMGSAKHVCKVSVIPPAVKVQQITEGTWLVFHPISMTVQIKCPDRPGLPETKRFRGTRKLTLAAGCVATNTEYEIEAPYQISAEYEVSVVLDHYWRVSSFLYNHTPSQLAPLIPEDLVDPVGIPNLVAEYERIGEQYRHQGWTASLTTLFIILAVLFIAVLLVTWCLRKKIRLYMARAVLKHSFLSQLSMALPTYLQPRGEDHNAVRVPPHPYGPNFHPGTNPYQHQPSVLKTPTRTTSVCDLPTATAERRQLVLEKYRSQADLSSPDCAGRVRRVQEDFRPTAPQATPRTRRRLDYPDLAPVSPYKKAIDGLREAKEAAPARHPLGQEPPADARPLTQGGNHGQVMGGTLDRGARPKVHERDPDRQLPRRSTCQDFRARDEFFPEESYMALKDLRPLRSGKTGVQCVDFYVDESEQEYD